MKTGAAEVIKGARIVRPSTSDGQQDAQTRNGNGCVDMDRSVDVTAVVLAGAYGHGDCPIQASVSIPLVPVAFQPLICQPLRWLRSAGICKVSICGNNESQQVWRVLGDGSALGMDLEYYRDVMPRGPAGCVRDAAAGRPCRAVLVVDATIIPRVDVRALIETHVREGADMTMVVSRSPSRWGAGHAALEPAGVFVFDPSVVEAISASGYQDIKETLIPKLYQANRNVMPFVLDIDMAPRCTDVGSYLFVNEWMTVQAVEAILTGQAKVPGYYAAGSSVVHESAVVHDDARIEGPALIGQGVTLEAGSTVFGPATIGQGSRLERGAIVNRSVLWNNACVGEDAIADGCVLAGGAVVAADDVLCHAVRFADRVRLSHRNRPPLVSYDLGFSIGPISGVEQSGGAGRSPQSSDTVQASGAVQASGVVDGAMAG